MFMQSAKNFTQLGLWMVLWSVAPLACAHSVLKNYEELSQALTQGHTVRAIIKLSECETDSKSPAKPNQDIGGMNFTHFNQYPVSMNGKITHMIATSVNVLVRSEKYGPVYNYVRLRVFEDNTVEILSEFLQTTDHSVLNTAAFQCRLDKGITLYNISA